MTDATNKIKLLAKQLEVNIPGLEIQTRKNQ